VIARDVAGVRADLMALDAPCFVVRDAAGIGTTSEHPGAGAGVQVLAAVPPLAPESLGDPAFRAAHGLARNYMAGAMANGIASARMVAALARAGVLGSFGAAGLLPGRIDEALGAIRRDAPGRPFACNLIHSPSEPALERAIVDACLRHEVRAVEASAFMDLTSEIVRYRLAGLRRDAAGRVVATHRVIAKVSRAEVAEKFIRPAPGALARDLAERGEISAEQAEWAAGLPLADDVTVEADSGGHTDRRPLTVLLPDILALRDRLARELGYTTSGYPVEVRVGAAGGIGTPAAAAAAFAMGAAYVVTGSVNQASVEADQSDTVKRLLAAAGVADVEMAPSADMFEAGVQVQVLRRGTMFAGRAARLYDLYRRHDGLESLPPGERAGLEAKVFARPLDDVWTDCVRFFSERDPEQIARAEGSPKRRMALVFRWYLGLSSGWGIAGTPERAADYQVWCGPAMGAFNGWVTGSYLAACENRAVADIADELMRGAAVASRVSQLRLAGVRLPSACTTYIPSPRGGARAAKAGEK
jgi:PfaD family protein